MPRISTFARAAARFIPRFAEEVVCTVCGHSRKEAKQFIAGPGVYLCSDCFDIAAKQLAPRHLATDTERCTFCRAFRAPSDVTHLGALTICADCLGMMDSILAEARQTPGPAAPQRD